MDSLPLGLSENLTTTTHGSASADEQTKKSGYLPTSIWLFHQAGDLIISIIKSALSKSFPGLTRDQEQIEKMDSRPGESMRRPALDLRE